MRRTRQKPAHAEPDDIARLVRSRRSQLDWSLAKLAHAAGLRSPAYVFHIENGSKTPSEAVARRLAEALGLDARLFAAWARMRGRAALGPALEASETLRRWLGEGEGEGRPPGAGVAAAAQPTPGIAGAADVVAIPVLPEGADPDAAPVAPRAIETLHLARALLPPLEAGDRLVGYRLSAHGARRVPDTLRPGDCIVVRLGSDAPGADAPCALRLGGRVEIARVRVRDGMLYLPPPAGANDHADERLGRADSTLVGRVVLVFRRWL
jgi:transcriptional regulator with XRE-family HTH domain